MSGSKISYEGMTKNQVSQFLREIADRLEGKTPEEGLQFDVDPGDFLKLQIKMKKELCGFSMSIKLKEGYEGLPLEESLKNRRPKYKKLKKNMKITFREISNNLINNILPNDSIVSLFLTDSKLMITCFDKGDEYYEEYSNACEKFRLAFEAKEIEACKIAFAELTQIKTKCHKQYK
ncbi:XXXCH domain-containing-protein [Desulfonema limicola]|uniref:XXXCH domain-containing-protein n=1 Tax=Desulfonema limicola TaxID=45656 RepID=A0A975GJC9_9BACT|nr:GAK system XXXCH domain-containing protein [Desulfonema limicola]QTA83561.1 XXXCH domain-containing-protein [Desulfonema limicola]